MSLVLFVLVLLMYYLMGHLLHAEDESITQDIKRVRLDTLPIGSVFLLHEPNTIFSAVAGTWRHAGVYLGHQQYFESSNRGSDVLSVGVFHTDKLFRRAHKHVLFVRPMVYGNERSCTLIRDRLIKYMRASEGIPYFIGVLLTVLRRYVPSMMEPPSEHTVFCSQLVPEALYGKQNLECLYLPIDIVHMPIGQNSKQIQWKLGRLSVVTAT
jgi:hypothetical protein